jgi:hypothetical protein
MYPIRSNDNGYSFETSNGTIYEVYFTRLENLRDYFNKEIGTDNVYYFGIERMTENKGGKDFFIKRTIAYIIFTFFVSNPTAVLIFNYSNDNYSVKGRRKIFKKWFEEYAEHTLFQFYQHDYSDELSVCAIYRRHGKNFDDVRNGIKRITETIDKQFDQNK